MLTRINRRLAADDGISLIEMLVAVVMLGVVLSASASTLIASFVALTQNETRTRAAALSNEVLEEMRTLSWNDVGLFAAEFPVSSPPTENAVLLNQPAGTRVAGSRAPRPAQEIPRGGTTYQVTRTVEWVHNDLKRLHVAVRWTDASGAARTTQAETTRAATPGDEVTTEFGLSHYDVRPSIVNITGDVDGSGNDTSSTAGTLASGESLVFEARTRAAADYVRVTWTDRTGGPQWVDLTNGGAGKIWTKTVTSGQFRNGDTTFTFQAVRALPVQQEVFGTKVVRFNQPLRFKAMTLSSNPAPGSCLDPTEVTPSLTVDLDINGVVAGDDPVYVVLSTAEVLETESVGVTNGGTLFQVVVPGGYPDDLALHAVVDPYGEAPSAPSDPVAPNFLRQGVSC
jgi:type II secretory pathway pseudopilin PulG